MAVTEALGRRVLWREIGSKAKSKMLRAVQGQALYWITRRYRRAIIPMAMEMRISPGKLRDHIDFLLKKGVSKREIPDRIVQDLETLRELRGATRVEPERWNNFLQKHSLAEAMEEMRQHAQMQAQMQRKAA